MTEGKKNDNKKINFRSFSELSLAIMEVAKVLEHGAVKYGFANWRLVPDLQTRYNSAQWRHQLKRYWEGPIDQESGCYHLAHQICSLLFLLQKELEEDYDNIPYPFNWTEEQLNLLKEKTR